MADMQVLRPAGYNERRCITRDGLGLYGSIVTLGTYITSSHKTQLSKEVVYKASKSCIEQHAALSTVVQDAESERPYLVRAARIDLDKHVHLLEEAPASRDHLVVAKELLEKAHNQALDSYESRPQWQLFVAPLASDSSSQTARHYHVALATSHALADGMSGMTFHKTFLRALCNVQEITYNGNAVFEPDTSTVLPPSQELAGNFEVSWSFLLGPLVREYCPKWLARTLGMSNDTTDAAKVWTGAPKRPHTPANATDLLQTAVHVTVVPHDVLQNALKVCRQHDARLTGLLNHLFARAVATALRSRHQKYTRFNVETAIDLRRCLPAGKDQMANYVSAVDEIIDVSLEESNAIQSLTENDWTAISDSSKKLAQASSTLAEQPVGLLKYLSNYREWTLKNAKEPAKASFGMSNLGTFSTPISSDALVEGGEHDLLPIS